jgi:hypothetical protein
MLFLGRYGATEIQYLAPTLGVGADNTYRLGANTGPSLRVCWLRQRPRLRQRCWHSTRGHRFAAWQYRRHHRRQRHGHLPQFQRLLRWHHHQQGLERLSLDTGAGGTLPLGSGIVEVFGTLRTRHPGGLNSPSFYNSVTNANNNVILMRPGSLVTIFDQLGSVADGQGRWADATGQDLNGGNLRFDGVANAQSVETIGDITVSKGSTSDRRRPCWRWFHHLQRG